VKRIGSLVMSVGLLDGPRAVLSRFAPSGGWRFYTLTSTGRVAEEASSDRDLDHPGMQRYIDVNNYTSPGAPGTSGTSKK
jgi:hypothetical protein